MLLQNDLDSLAAWSRDWLLQFSREKCVVLRVRPNTDFRYSIDGHYLDNVNSQKDLGIHITSDLKPSSHIDKITKSANQRLGLIRRCFTNKSPMVIKKLYCGLVRPILENNSSAWNPWLHKDIDKLERVQHRCQKLSSGDLHLPPLAQRRMKADMRETFKLLNGHYKTDPDSMFNIGRHSGLRGHHLKLSKVNSRTEVRQQFFCNRVINNWNGLDENIVSAPSVDSFKHRLEQSNLW